MSRILYVSSEAFPLVKTGGLADVAGSLPVALLKKSQDVRLLLPAYRGVLDKLSRKRLRATTQYYDLPVNIYETRLPGSQLITWLVDCPAMYDRDGGPYVDSHGQPWSDNAQRFALFCLAAVDLAMDRLSLQWQAEVVHCNDWQTGLVPALLTLEQHPPVSIFTIHNLAYQGVFPQQTFTELQLPESLWHMNGVEYHQQLSFIKGGIACATKVNAVSPHYAEEILEGEFGYGLDGLLRHRGEDLSGILNGIDSKVWNPGSDKWLAQKYNRRSLDKKVLNKTALQEELGLPVNEKIAMIGMVGRLVEQKGLDIILGAMDELLSHPIQLVILGTGQAEYQQALRQLSQRYDTQLKVIVGYDEQLAHRIEAASDLYLMPSTFEPCGLNQLYSLQYGTLPIVTPVGGLVDTVIDASDEHLANKTANGFVMEACSIQALLQTIQHALALYAKPAAWRQLQLTAMQSDHSWQHSADQYIELYQQALSS